MLVHTPLQTLIARYVMRTMTSLRGWNSLFQYTLCLHRLPVAMQFTRLTAGLELARRLSIGFHATILSTRWQGDRTITNVYTAQRPRYVTPFPMSQGVNVVQ